MAPWRARPLVAMLALLLALSSTLQAPAEAWVEGTYVTVTRYTLGAPIAGWLYLLDDQLNVPSMRIADYLGDRCNLSNITLDLPQYYWASLYYGYYANVNITLPNGTIVRNLVFRVGLELARDEEPGVRVEAVLVSETDTAMVEVTLVNLYNLTDLLESYLYNNTLVLAYMVENITVKYSRYNDTMVSVEVTVETGGPQAPIYLYVPEQCRPHEETFTWTFLVDEASLTSTTLSGESLGVLPLVPPSLNLTMFLAKLYNSALETLQPVLTGGVVEPGSIAEELRARLLSTDNTMYYDGFTYRLDPYLGRAESPERIQIPLLTFTAKRLSLDGTIVDWLIGEGFVEEVFSYVESGNMSTRLTLMTQALIDNVTLTSTNYTASLGGSWPPVKLYPYWPGNATMISLLLPAEGMQAGPDPITTPVAQALLVVGETSLPWRNVTVTILVEEDLAREWSLQDPKTRASALAELKRNITSLVAELEDEAEQGSLGPDYAREWLHMLVTELLQTAHKIGGPTAEEKLAQLIGLPQDGEQPQQPGTTTPTQAPTPGATNETQGSPDGQTGETSTPITPPGGGDERVTGEIPIGYEPQERGHWQVLRIMIGAVLAAAVVALLLVFRRQRVRVGG